MGVSSLLELDVFGVVCIHENVDVKILVKAELKILLKADRNFLSRTL